MRVRTESEGKPESGHQAARPPPDGLRESPERPDRAGPPGAGVAQGAGGRTQAARRGATEQHRPVQGWPKGQGDGHGRHGAARHSGTRRKSVGTRGGETETSFKTRHDTAGHPGVGVG